MSATRTAKRTALATSALAMLAVAAMPQAIAAEAPDVPADITVSAENVPVSGLASEGTRKAVEQKPQRALLSGVVCGSSYPTLVHAERLPYPSNRKATVYIWQGKTTGPNFYDKAICATLWNDTGKRHKVEARLCSNYTSDGCDTNSGWFSSYAGPVYQKRGYCGTMRSRMWIDGKMVVSRINRVGWCN
ncbi:hypothetical protein ACX6XY_11815 [Streptomyces sp. O3]